VVGADQLKAAHGNVRCGTCFESFDAIAYLSDGPADSAGAHSDAHAPSTAPAFDSRSASAQLSSTLVALGAGQARPQEQSAHTEAQALAASGEHEAIDQSAFADTEAREQADENVGENVGENADESDDERVGESGATRVADDDIDHDLPEVLREQSEEQSARSAARRRNIGYGVAGVALLALLAFQYLFFNPEAAARQYPQWRDTIESMCAHIGCVLPERRDPSRIRVLSRDVRVHPKFEGVLQIKATLANAAPFRQPYPRLRFTLFNVNGQTIATRVFRPSEYLGRNVSPSARLRPRSPFQIALDVLVPEEAAVSFEFQFL